MDFTPTLEQLTNSANEKISNLQKERKKLMKMLYSLCDFVRVIPAEIEHSADIKFMYESAKKFQIENLEWLDIPLFFEEKK